MVMRPEGPVEEKVSVGTLLNQGQGLRTHAHHCQGCKANLPGRPFACYGSVSYPISARSEEWLRAYPKTPVALQVIQAQAKWRKAL